MTVGTSGRGKRSEIRSSIPRLVLCVAADKSSSTFTPSAPQLGADPARYKLCSNVAIISFAVVISFAAAP